MKELRKHYQAGEKVAILRRHLLRRSPSRSSALNWICSPRSFIRALGVVPLEMGSPTRASSRVAEYHLPVWRQPGI